MKGVLFLLTSIIFLNGLHAQSIFPRGDFWALNAGAAMNNILVDGASFSGVIDPKLWLSPALMVGSRMGANYSVEENDHDILTLETQVYLRWNFLRLGKQDNPLNIFAQGGIGLLSAYRGGSNPFNDVTMTRGSILADAAVGVTIPLTSRWNIEPSVRAGYPHIVGFTLTAGYKIPLPQKVLTIIEYQEIIKLIKISAIEFVLFGPDSEVYNAGIDRDAQQLNELVLNYTAQTLRENPDYMVRIEGHANPLTVSVSETDDLMTLSAQRANTVADQLRARGISDDQMIIVAFGGTRNATNEWDVRNRNRRVELMIMQVDSN